MAKTIIIKEIASKHTQAFYDETPTNDQLKSFFNQCIARLNAEISINLPFIENKEGTKPSAILQEEWDKLADLNGVYVLDDNWMRRLIFPYFGYRVMYIEEGANSAEAGEPYSDFMEGMREFKYVVQQVVPSEYLEIPGVVAGQEDSEQKGNVFLQNLDANPYGGGF